MLSIDIADIVVPVESIVRSFRNSGVIVFVISNREYIIDIKSSTFLSLMETVQSFLDWTQSKRNNINKLKYKFNVKINISFT